MFSPRYCLASVVGQVATDNADAAANPWAWRCALIDQVIAGSGLALLVLGGAVWLCRGRRDPLAGAPARPNRLVPEHLIAVVVAFLFILILLQWAVQLLPAGVELKLTAGSVAQLLGGTMCLIVAAKLFDGGVPRFVLGGGRVPARVVEGALLFLIALPVCDVVFTVTRDLVTWIAPAYDAPEHAVIDALRTHTEPAWLLWLGAALVAPLSEELFFRGLIQTFLRQATGRPWAAVVLAALVFGIAHNPQPHAVPTITVLGLILGVSYERTGSLVAPMTLHVLFNLKTLVWEGLGVTSG